MTFSSSKVGTRVVAEIGGPRRSGVRGDGRDCVDFAQPQHGSTYAVFEFAWESFTAEQHLAGKVWLALVVELVVLSEHDVYTVNEAPVHCSSM
jgi:hypothetical protein